MQCLILFVTHYPPLAEMEKLFPDHVTNNHMSFFVADSEGKVFKLEANFWKIYIFKN